MNLRVSPRTVQGQAVEKLRSAILAGMFKPGDRLIEADLCELLGVSRPSVREALRSLEAERLIAIIPNRGPQIPILSWQEAQEIYQVRSLLEGEAAALSALRSRPEDHKRMREALAKFGKATRQGEKVLQITSTGELYDVILNTCGNRIIEEILRGLLARINFLRERSMSLPGRAKFSLKEMTGLCDAIERGDADAARAAAIHHVEQACAAAREAYDRDARRD
ncbi:GntR family transcriptional regulator [Xanthobacter dioxanivorans]|uniref:GntR family transcriptional regulator n=1 Tax=Xanthobacter dioxanivorans TaxID=2528964 RepID=A0A974PTS3_9HYPH|nr:GntR family transcriptional regulator [Xanthobacter dioxanivorans]QRG09614.1 GntR family transcriptional regulator [Xanthobacter dioxanivorans]